MVGFYLPDLVVGWSARPKPLKTHRWQRRVGGKSKGVVRQCTARSVVFLLGAGKAVLLLSLILFSISSLAYGIATKPGDSSDRSSYES